MREGDAVVSHTGYPSPMPQPGDGWAKTYQVEKRCAVNACGPDPAAVRPAHDKTIPAGPDTLPACQLARAAIPTLAVITCACGLYAELARGGKSQGRWECARQPVGPPGALGCPRSHWHAVLSPCRPLAAAARGGYPCCPLSAIRSRPHRLNHGAPTARPGGLVQYAQSSWNGSSGSASSAHTPAPAPAPPDIASFCNSDVPYQPADPQPAAAVPRSHTRASQRATSAAAAAAKPGAQ